MTSSAELARRLLPSVRDAAREAGEMAARSFRRDARTSARVWSKAGGSPVTAADMAVDAFLARRLNELLPEAGWLSEESINDPSRMGRRFVWVVDPIDGTRAFLSGNPDWCVAIALLAEDRPVLGIVHAPALDSLYEASLGEGARRNGQSVTVSSLTSLEAARVAGPKPLVDRFERAFSERFERLPRVPSLALRIARVAEGAIDLTLVSANACDWDIAASDLILAEAGGRLTSLEGALPAYNRPDPLHGELLAVPGGLHRRAVEVMTERPCGSRSAR
jgi:myo-inositol-1(or 4)-monophosphatase